MNASGWRRWWPSLTGSRRRPSEREGLSLASIRVFRILLALAAIGLLTYFSPLRAHPPWRAPHPGIWGR